MPKVSVCMQVYNTDTYLAQCVESVLNQTLRDFEFLITDNGSTDGCKEMLQSYAAQDSRIRLTRREQNIYSTLALRNGYDSGAGEYFTNIDSDDWWEPDYLEKLLDFAENNQLDIACTGTVMHIMETGGQGLRKVDQPMLLPRAAFAEAFPWYHVFFRTVWGKLIRMDCLRAVPRDAVIDAQYGTDTLWCFQALRHANRIGIDTSLLHHYRLHKQSISYQYSSGRFDADVYLYNDSIDFLSAFGPISAQNKNFLQLVYSCALLDTTGIIQSSNLSPADKLREYRRIAENPVTLETYQECEGEDAARSKTTLLQRTLEAGAALRKEPDDDLRFMARVLLPRCGQTVTAKNAQLFLMNALLFRALVQDDQSLLLQNLLELMKKNQGIKKFSIPAAIQSLTVDNPLLCQIDDAVFLRRYGEIYWKVWQGEHMTALDEMTGILLEKHINSGQETFLQLYISLAAVMEQSPAFIFGKIRLAWLYLRQDRMEECRAIVEDLTEMGVESADLDALKEEMDRLKEK